MAAVARGLMSEPELLILDEPSLGLIPLNVSVVFRIFKEISQETAVLIVNKMSARPLKSLTKPLSWNMAASFSREADVT